MTCWKCKPGPCSGPDVAVPAAYGGFSVADVGRTGQRGALEEISTWPEPGGTWDKIPILSLDHHKITLTRLESCPTRAGIGTSDPNGIEKS